jgi:hypothetical protein
VAVSFQWPAGSSGLSKRASCQPLSTVGSWRPSAASNPNNKARPNGRALSHYALSGKPSCWPVPRGLPPK